KILVSPQIKIRRGVAEFKNVLHCKSLCSFGYFQKLKKMNPIDVEAVCYAPISSLENLYTNKRCCMYRVATR
nr:hypothetical protein [Tanacetum cinerariifolium]